MDKLFGEIPNAISRNVRRFGGIWEPSSSSSWSGSNTRTPSPNEEEDLLFWLPEYDDDRFASEEHLLLEKLNLLQLKEDLTKPRMTLPMVYPNAYYPSQLKTRITDVSDDTLFSECYLRCKGDYNVHLNPTLDEILYSEGSVKGYHNNLQYGFPVNNGGFSRSVDDSFIMQGKMLQRLQRLRPSIYPSNKKETIYHLAKDQEGCRLLQKKIEERKRETIDFVFYGVIDHVVELMENPFGNYLMQKFIEICSMEQRVRIIVKLTESPSELIRISLNTHGTRAVQKVIETLKTGQEIALVTCALRPGFLQLIKDLNGNHVVQKCLVSLKAEDNKFIFDAAAKHCVEMATHRHGCCVLQCCISHATGDQYTRLLFEISSNGLLLARDAFGNYVVQYILDLGDQSRNAVLLSQFKGNYVELSMQKFSSNVIEKCLKVLGEEERAKVIAELLRKETFVQLLQDPYGNYVIQSALLTTKGSPLHASLVQAIRPFVAKLKTNPYCRRIFSKILRNDN